jgi:alpha,alpha-trehalase
MFDNLDKAKHIANRGPVRLFALRKSRDLSAADVQIARDYIKTYWTKLERYHPKDEGSLIGVPKPYLVPSYAEGHEFDYDELFYWDSYFMVQGLLDDQHRELNMGILEDLFSIFKRYKIIPNSSQTYMTSRSQPPFLTSFIFDMYNAYKLERKWLRDAINIAKQEYETVWTGTRKPNARQVYQGLSRYYDFNYLHDIAETESGWDMTPRFGRKALNYLPVDLNALLYKYEMDFARTARILDAKDEAIKWEKRAADRREKMNTLMWDEGRGLFYDYNYVKEKRGNVSSLAAYYPMWAGMVDGQQAHAMVKALRRFEHKGGLSATDSLPFGQFVPGAIPTQWAYPNGWAPLHFMVVEGLRRYGYHQDARRIAVKWLKCNLQWFNDHGVFLEKYNVVSPEKPPVKGVYPAQTGFGWTNAVFERFCQEFIDGRTPFGDPVH